MLAGGEPRGLPGTTITRVEFQRAADDRPLDDVIVHGIDRKGSQAVLEIQVKRTVTFTPSDTVFSQVVSQIAKAAAKPEFNSARYELAVAIERTSTKIEQSYQEVLSWARCLESHEIFAQHIARIGQSNDDMRQFVITFRKNLQLAGAEHNDQEVWRILRRFQILVFDFNQPGSASELLARERAAMALTPEDAARAADLWNVLAILAQESAAKSGEVTLVSLRDFLTTQHSYHLAGDRRLAAARDALQEASIGALRDISVLVGTVHIDRAQFVAQTRAALDTGRYVEIRGDSGVGKSGVLRHLAEQISLEAQVIVLSPSRTIRGGWLYLRSALGCSVSARDFLSDLASDGGAVLFIDGADIFEDEEKKATVRDLVRAAAEVPNFAVVVTARRNFNLEEPSWLPQEALDALGRAPSVVIDRLTAEEIGQLRTGNPSLVPLLEEDHPARMSSATCFALPVLQGKVRKIRFPTPRRRWRNSGGATQTEPRQAGEKGAD